MGGMILAPRLANATVTLEVSLKTLGCQGAKTNNDKLKKKKKTNLFQLI